jgi:hypothetical protein
VAAADQPLPPAFSTPTPAEGAQGDLLAEAVEQAVEQPLPPEATDGSQTEASREA